MKFTILSRNENFVTLQELIIFLEKEIGEFLHTRLLNSDIYSYLMFKEYIKVNETNNGSVIGENRIGQFHSTSGDKYEKLHTILFPKDSAIRILKSAFSDFEAFYELYKTTNDDYSENEIKLIKENANKNGKFVKIVLENGKSFRKIYLLK